MQSQMIFTMGLPAAGKSTVVAREFAGEYGVIDPDAIKESHPDYDPREAFRLHDWSTEIAEVLFRQAIASGCGRWVVDGTGTNAEKMIRRMREAKAAGFTVRLVYVTCSLETSLRRAAGRERQVPETVIRQKALDIQTAFEIVSHAADFVQVIDNDADTF